MLKTETCERCGSPLELSASGGAVLCARCLARSLAPDQEDDAASGISGLTLPRRFGAYELLDEIGRGGMGVVYRARQLALDRSVAVKLLLAGAYSSEATLRRFRLEAAAAASLQHSNIVPIHDYGECDGQPFYAMDLIAGRDLAAVCNGRPLEARRATQLVVVLARAVQHAHDAGILHRDLKPSNILIDADDQPHITDFGLAKRLDDAGGVTVTGQMVGSPSYAAPEQALGRDDQVGVLSDVYGLGALLYHLVTGRAPFSAATPTETLRLVLETDPPPPRLLNPSLPRDLETICLTCLAKESARRYSTARAVADDCDRFLNRRPVCARPPSVVYRMGKFARRHRTAVMGVAAVFFSLVAGLGVSLVGFRRAVEHQRAADSARGQAEQLVGLMTRELKPALEHRGGLPQLVQLCESTVRYYDALPPELRTATTDRRHANALAALARLRGLSLDDRPGAETALQAALALREAIARENPDDPEAVAEWLWDEWEFPWVTGDTAAYRSQARQEEAIRRWQALLMRFPDNLRVKEGLAEVLHLYSQCAAVDFNQPNEAVVAAERCRALVEDLVAARPNDRTLGDLIEKSLRALATALQTAGRRAEAVAASEQALAYCAEALKADPGNVKLREQTATAARNLSYRAMGFNPARGLAAERIAREHYRVLVELNPEDRGYRFHYALTHMMECYYFHAFDGGLAAQRKAFRDFHALLEPFVGRKGCEDTLTHWTLDCLRLAGVAAWAGEPAESRREIERARLRLTDWLGRLLEGSFERRLVHTRFLSLEGWALYWLNDWSGMARVARDSLAETETGLREKPDESELLLRRAYAHTLLGIAALRGGRPAVAIALLGPAIATMRATSAANADDERPTHLGFARLGLVEALAQNGDLGRARQEADRMLLETNFVRIEGWGTQEWKARMLLLAASCCDPAEAPRIIALTDRAEKILTGPAAEGRLSVNGKADLTAIARLRSEATANLTPEALERLGREFDTAGAAGSGVVERVTTAGEATWNPSVWSSAIASAPARGAELARRETLRALVTRNPDHLGYQFLLAATYRMECYVHLGLDGQVEPGREAFRQYDAFLEPFVGRKGYESVLRTRLTNSLHRAQLAASVGDRADAEGQIAEARARFAAYAGGLPEGSPERRLARVRFLEAAAWSAWWLRDWPALSQWAKEALLECEAGLKDQPANEELVLRRLLAGGFAALADYGATPSAETLAALQSSLAGARNVGGVWEPYVMTWAVHEAEIDGLRKTGQTAHARSRIEPGLAYIESWAPNLPEHWLGQKRMAKLDILLASLLDPVVPAEAVRRNELLDRGATILAPGKVAGRLTVDVREMLAEIERLRVGAVAGGK